MDTSETYIKMCDCEDIQNLVPFRDRYGERQLDPTYNYTQFDKWEGSLFAIPDQIDYVILFHRDADEERWLMGDYWTHEHHNDFIWLPRQDQLQEMIGESGIYFSLARFPVFIRELERSWNLNNASYEQLWLAFVMKEKFNKAWDGEKWA